MTWEPSCTARLMAVGAWCCTSGPHVPGMGPMHYNQGLSNPSLTSHPDISSEACCDPGAFLYSTAHGRWCLVLHRRPFIITPFLSNPSLFSYPDISSEACRDPGAFLYSTAHGGWCLVLHQRAPCSWYEARARCVAWGGRLAVLRSEQVYEQLKSHLRQTLQVSGDYWIGLRDSELEWQQGEFCCF